MEKEFISPKIKSASTALKKALARNEVYDSNQKSSNSYSLLRDSQTKEKEVAHLTAQSNLVDKLLEKVKDGEQCTNLIKRKRDCLIKKMQLSKILNEIQIIQHMISRCCTPLFNFTTAFCENAASISCQISKSRIDFLKEMRKGENDLLDLTINTPLLSVLEGLEMETYRPFLERYSEKLFSDFSLSDKGKSYYNKCLLLSRKLCVDFAGVCYLHFYRDDFDLCTIKEFLKEVCDADKEAACAVDRLLPHRLVGLNLVFICNVLAEFIKLKPLVSNFEYLRPFFECDKDIVVDFESSKKINALHRLLSLQKDLKQLETECSLFQKENKSLSKADIREALAFYQKLQEKGSFIKGDLSHLLCNTEYQQEAGLLFTFLKEQKTKELADIAFTKIGLAPFPKNFDCKNNIAAIENNIKALRYFFHIIIVGYDQNKLALSEGLQFFLEALSLDETNIISVDLDKMEVEDFIDLSYFTFCSFFLSDFNIELKGFLDRLSVFRLERLSSFFILELKDIDDLQIFFKEQNKVFLGNNYLDETHFNEKKAVLLGSIKPLLTSIQDLIFLLEEFKNLTLNFDPALLSISMICHKAEFINFFQINNSDLLGLLSYLEKEKENILSRKKEIEGYSLSAHQSQATKLIDEKPTISVISSQILDNLEGKLNEFIVIFYEPLACLARNFSEGLVYIKNPFKNKAVAKKKHYLEQRFASAMGQIRAALSQLTTRLNAWETNAIEFKERSLSLSELLGKLKQLKTAFPQEEETPSRFTLLQQTIDFDIESIAEQVKKMLNEYLFYNEKLECLLRDFSRFSEANAPPLFFSAMDAYKKKESRLFNNYSSLTKRFDRLEKLMKAVRYDKNEEVIRLYGLVEDGRSGWDVFYLLKEKNIFLAKSNIHRVEKLPSETSADQVACVKTDIKNKAMTHKKIIFSEQKNRKKTKSNVYCSIKSNKKENKLSVALFSLEQFKAWNDNFSEWRVRTDSQLSRLFYVIEQCSFSILSNTAPAFLKYLEFYKNLLDEKKLEFEVQRADVSAIFQVSNANEVVVGYLLQHEAWLNNQLARLVACSQFICKCIERYPNKECMAGGAPLKGLSTVQTEMFNHLLANYLSCVIEYNKTKVKLAVEENKLSDLSRTFITRVLRVGSLEQMDREAESLLTTFSEQITLIDQLNHHIKQQDESKHQLKAQLEFIVPANVLRFYMSRIDPGKEQGFMNHPNTVYNPSAFFPNREVIFPIVLHPVNYSVNPCLFAGEVYCSPMPF